MKMKPSFYFELSFLFELLKCDIVCEGIYFMFRNTVSVFLKPEIEIPNNVIELHELNISATL